MKRTDEEYEFYINSRITRRDNIASLASRLQHHINIYRQNASDKSLSNIKNISKYMRDVLNAYDALDNEINEYKNIGGDVNKVLNELRPIITAFDNIRKQYIKTRKLDPTHEMRDTLHTPKGERAAEEFMSARMMAKKKKKSRIGLISISDMNEMTERANVLGGSKTKVNLKYQ
jgi:hypothetical protein